MRDVPGRRLTVHGSEIYLEESGFCDTYVVFESGNGSGRTMWDPVVPLLADIARTVAYDRAGRGRSSRAEPPQSIDDMAATLVALVEALAPTRVILVGHSMGGLIVRRANRFQARNHGTIREYQRRYAEQVGGQFEDADSEHIVPAEQPGQVAAAIRRLAGP